MFSSRARRIALETLEDRTNPAWTITVAGNAVAFTSTDDFVALALSRNSAGFLQHDLQDTGLRQRDRPEPEPGRGPVAAGDQPHAT